MRSSNPAPHPLHDDIKPIKHIKHTKKETTNFIFKERRECAHGVSAARGGEHDT